MASDLVERRYLLVKRGLYYGPDNMGYVGVKDRAGRYLASDARPDCGVSAIHEDEAPLFAPACWEETKAQYWADALAARDAEIARLKALLEEAEKQLKRIAAECVIPLGTAAQMYARWRKLAVDRVDIARAFLAKLKGD